ncbi:MAG: hypothetical protein KJP02_00950 [Octadecabacter sp.]|nr:hypothetical protein [Octadecabacter sp.]
MFEYFKDFRADDQGAVTVDWVVLTAVIVGLAIAVITTVGMGATHKSDGVGAMLSTHEGAKYQ